MKPDALPVARLIYRDAVTLLYAGQSLKVGRAPENDIIIDDLKVSRTHALLEWNGMGFSLRDLASVNGTFVGGERLSSAPRLLRDGDEICIHTQKLQYFIQRAEPVRLPLEVGRPDASIQPAVGARLLVVEGPDNGQEYPLWGEQVTLGRGARRQAARNSRSDPADSGAASTEPGSRMPVSWGKLPTWEIRLSDPSVSRPHARLERRSGSYYLLDLASDNGTRLNGQPITAPVALNEGDLIEIGETCLRFFDVPR